MSEKKGSKLFSILQNFGPTMMMVIAVIPIGGLLLGIGVFMQNETFMNQYHFLASTPVFAFSSFIRAVGNMIIGNLHILFAAAIAEGLCKHDGVGAFSAILGFLTMNTVIGSVLGLTSEKIADSTLYTTVLGMPTLQMGVFGGICIGIMVGVLYKNFKDVKFPQGISFFQGKRFVPIITVVGAMVLGVLFSFIWPPIQNGILALSKTVGDTTNPVALYIFGLGNRLLIPFGLHNLWYPVFYFQVGSWTNAAGQTIIGDLNIYLAQLAEGAKITHGLTSGGCYLFPGFCIAAALAISKMAKPENRKKTFGLFAAGIVTIIFTGITEPIEFVFMFACFPLYIIHAFLMSLSFPILCLLNVHVGSTFCGGLMDWIVYGVLQNSPGWQLIIPLNVAIGGVYYLIYKTFIKVLDFKTPGREDDVVVVDASLKQEDVLAAKVLKELGGKENISNLDACATRLRVTVKNTENIKKEVFTSLGASGTMQNGNDYQIIFGTQAAFLKEQIQAIMNGEVVENLEIKKETAELVDEEILIPMKGTLVELSEVPDNVFAEGMMGCGFAIDPEGGIVYSPVNGRIDSVFPTKHAISIVTDGGKEVVIHMGMDTVKLEGKPFEIYVKKDELIEAGQKIAQMDLVEINKKAPSAITPVVFTNMPDYDVVLEKKGKVAEKEDKFMHFKKKDVI